MAEGPFRHTIGTGVDTGNIAMLTLLDLSAAFDSVDHNTLLRQLRTSYCLSVKVIDWFTSYLSDRKQQVRTTTSSSVQSAVLFGVPQDSVLWPILFLLYIADLLQLVKRHLTSHAYADDTQIDGHCQPSPDPDWPVLFVWVMPWCRQSPARDLGVYIDADMTMRTQVTCFAALRQIRIACDGLSLSTPCWVLTLIRTLVITQVDQCNSVLLAEPTALRAECRRSAHLLAPDVRTRNSAATGASRIQFRLCSGISLCAWHSTGVPDQQPAADIRDRRSSLSPLCRRHDTAGAVDSSGYPCRPRLSGGCRAGVEQYATRDSGLVLTCDISEADQVSPFRQSYGWLGAVCSDRQQTSALSCTTVLSYKLCKVPRNCCDSSTVIMIMSSHWRIWMTGVCWWQFNY